MREPTAIFKVRGGRSRRTRLKYWSGPAGPRWRWKLANRRPLLHGELICSCRCSIAIGHFRVLFVVVLGRRAAPAANAQSNVLAMSSSLPPHHHLRILLLAFFPPPRSPTARLLVLRRRRSVLQVGAAPLLHAAHGAARRWQGSMPSRSSISSSGSAQLSSVTADFFMNQILIYLDNHIRNLLV